MLRGRRLPNRLNIHRKISPPRRMLSSMDVLDALLFARGRLQQSRPATDAVIKRIEQAEALLEPGCNDTVTAARELHAIIRELKALPRRAATGRATGFRKLLQDPTPRPLPGVQEAIGRLGVTVLELEKV